MESDDCGENWMAKRYFLPSGEQREHHPGLAYVQQVLVQTLKPGDMVIMDNLPAHGETRLPD